MAIATTGTEASDTLWSCMLAGRLAAKGVVRCRQARREGRMEGAERCLRNVCVVTDTVASSAGRDVRRAPQPLCARCLTLLF